MIMLIIHTDTDDTENPLRGGQPVRTYEINSRLSSRHQIKILTATYPHCSRKVLRGKLEYQRLGFGIPFFGLSYHLSFLATLGFMVNRLPHDLVVEEFTPPFGFCMLPLWTKKPVVSIVQWFFFQDWERRYKLPFERMMRTIPSRVRYRDFIVQTDKMGDYFKDLVPAAHVWKVPCGIDDEAFSDTVCTGDYALFVGRLDVHHKGLDYLLDAWQYLANAQKIIPLRIAGAGPGDEYLRSQIIKRGLLNTVQLMGRIEGPEKHQLLQHCRFLVMPSRQETFGITALEAMAAAKPVLAFDIDHLNELLSPKWAVLATLGNVSELAEGAGDLWGDPGRCRVLGDIGREEAKKYRWCEIAKMQEVIYQEVVGRTALR